MDLLNDEFGKYDGLHTLLYSIFLLYFFDSAKRKKNTEQKTQIRQS